MKLHKLMTRKSQQGVTMIEYALIAALIAVAAIAALTLIGTDLTAKFTAIGNALK
jgi:pilus assembly protein Flp/PilA